MITEVFISELLQKQIRKRQIPGFILEKFKAWAEAVKREGLEKTRRLPGFHDEKLSGRLEGLRSIRLTKGWRAYYVIEKRTIEFVRVERIDKHEY